MILLSRAWGVAGSRSPRPLVDSNRGELLNHLVCLTFDFDAVSLWLARGMASPTPISRGEFGVVAASRILELLASRSITSTWFIPGHTIESFPAVCREVVAAGHEIGHHGYLHEVPATLDREQEAAVLSRGIDCIRQLTGRPPAGYRSPSWDLSPNTVELLVAAGFEYDSSLMGDDYTPYPVRIGDAFPAAGPMRFGQQTALIELPVSWSLDDYPHFEYARTPAGLLQGLRSSDDVLQNWIDDFRYLRDRMDRGVVTYTFHPQVIGRGHRMLMLERLIDELTELGAEFVRLEQALDRWRSWR